MAPSPDRHGVLFAAKTTRPKLPRILARRHCLDALNSAHGCKILFISAPAGQGKTTLALSWLKESRTKAVWLSLDETDNDPAGFFPLLAEGFAVAFPSIQFDLPPLPTTAPFDPAAFARTYCQRLFAQATGRYALVFDDFHTLREDGPIPSILSALLDALSPSVQIVLLSRSLPPDFLAGWIAKRQLFLVDQALLRFSVGETHGLFEQVLGVPTTREQAEAIHDVTEGWVTGMILLREGGRATGSFLEGPIQPSAAGDHLADYLYHEVYRRLEPAVQDFMVRTSFFEDFSLKSPGTLGTSGNAESMIRILLRHHLVVEIATGEGRRFRYHALLREFLQTRVMALGEGERGALVQEAAAVLLAEERAEQAVDLYLSYRLYEPAMALIEQISLGAVFQGKRMTLRQWIGSIPPARIEGRPWLAYLLGAGQEFVAPQEAEVCYQRALQGFEAAGDPEGQLRALGSLIVLGFWRGHDFRPLKEYTRRGRTLLKRYGRTCSPIARTLFLLASGFSATYGHNDAQLGIRALLAAAALARQHGLLPLFVSAMSNVGTAAMYAGQFQLAKRCFTEAEQAVPLERLDPIFSSQLLGCRGVVESFLGETEASLASLIEAERICLANGLVTVLPFVQTNLARHRMVMGETEAAAIFAPIRHQVLQGGNRYFGAFTFYCEALGFLSTGQLSQALSHVQEADRLLAACGSPLFHSLNRYLVGVVLGEMGETREAERNLLAALRGLEQSNSQFFVFWVLLQLAKVALDQHNEKKAKAYLARALKFGKTEEYKEADGLLPRTKSILVNRALEWGLEPPYVRRLMAHWKVTPTIALKIHTLGRFEVRLHDQPVPPEAWKGRKTLQLLLALLTLGGKQVPKSRISDLLWPEAEGDRGATNFHTTLYRLQAVLGGSRNNGTGIITLTSGSVSVNPTQCWSDCCAFDDAVQQAKQAERRGRWSEGKQHLESARALYQGEYLPGFEEAWIVSRREALQRQWLWVEQQLTTPATPGR
ncbi:MAG: BTAD domain-containing putative transcriptional regulator [Nitrospirota bacterium]